MQNRFKGLSANFGLALNYLEEAVTGRLRMFKNEVNTFTINPPKYYKDHSPFALFIERVAITTDEYTTLLIALAPHLRPGFFDEILSEYLPDGGEFPAFGGIKGVQHRGILPTGETAQFILGGNDLAKRLEVQRLFSSEHWFAQKGILQLEAVRAGEPAMSGRLILDAEWVEEMTTGQVSPPSFSMRFPAEQLHTEMDWSDLVLPQQTLEQIREIKTWLSYHRALLEDWGMRKKLRPGYRVLFHGPPGTGKTLTAALLGKSIGKPVYRIDLSMVVSKFIGETEKNLSNLFAKAESKNWILFFDEADALFGKRTGVRDAHDKYANQEVSYLLQRVESYDGLVILASNFKNNIDDAFSRRFESIVHFPMPGSEERLSLWQKGFPDAVELEPSLEMEVLSNKYELSGATIMNVIQYACLQALSREQAIVLEQDLLTGIRRELLKTGKMMR